MTLGDLFAMEYQKKRHGFVLVQLLNFQNFWTLLVPRNENMQIVSKRMWNGLDNEKKGERHRGAEAPEHDEAHGEEGDEDGRPCGALGDHEEMSVCGSAIPLGFR